MIPQSPRLTPRWPGAPTPAQPSTAPAPERASLASTAPAPKRVGLASTASAPERVGRVGTAVNPSILTCADTLVEPVPRATGLVAWLACLPRRLGDQLFIMNDAEASWRGWQITKVHGGFGRRNRDPRFDALSAHPDEPAWCARR